MDKETLDKKLLDEKTWNPIFTKTSTFWLLTDSNVTLTAILTLQTVRGEYSS